MTGGAWIYLIATLGWIVLLVFGYRSYRVDGRRTLSMIMIWLGIFILMILLFALFMGQEGA